MGQVRSEIAYLNQGMLVRHIIAESSPLYRRTPEMLLREDAIFTLSVVINSHQKFTLVTSDSFVTFVSSCSVPFFVLVFGLRVRLKTNLVPVCGPISISRWRYLVSPSYCSFLGWYICQRRISMDIFLLACRLGLPCC